MKASFIISVLNAKTDIANGECAPDVRKEYKKIQSKYAENKKTMDYASAARKAQVEWLTEYLKRDDSLTPRIDPRDGLTPGEYIGQLFNESEPFQGETIN